MYEQRAEQLRAQHDMDNVWNSVKEGLAGAGGFLLDVLGKADVEVEVFGEFFSIVVFVGNGLL